MKQSLNAAQEKDDFLVGVPGILEALKSRKIECKVFETREESVSARRSRG